MRAKRAAGEEALRFASMSAILFSVYNKSMSDELSYTNAKICLDAPNERKIMIL